MKKLRSKGNLGIGASYSPSSESRTDAGEYSQLGKSLISMASNISIRNQQEFKVLAEQLYDPNITDATAEGILSAMERIIEHGLAESYSGTSQDQQKPNKRPEFTSFRLGKK